VRQNSLVSLKLLGVARSWFGGAQAMTGFK